MRALARRVAAVALFIPLLVPFVIIAPATLLAAGLAWLLLGWNEDRIDNRIMLNPALCWASDLPLVLFRTI